MCTCQPGVALLFLLLIIVSLALRQCIVDISLWLTSFGENLGPITHSHFPLVIAMVSSKGLALSLAFLTFPLTDRSSALKKKFCRGHLALSASRYLAPPLDITLPSSTLIFLARLVPLRVYLRIYIRTKTR